MPTEGAHGIDVDERVKELELRSAFTERTVEDLDAVVREFSLRVEKLEAELRRLRAQFEALGGTPDPRLRATGGDE